MGKKQGNFVFLHIIPLGIAGIVVYLALLAGWLSTKPEPGFDEARPVMKTGYLGRYYHFGEELSMAAGLDSGRAIVLLGSSELTHRDEPSIPYRFIPGQTGYPVVAMGMAGNQSVCILAQLAAMHKHLNGSKIVIILSPCWFYDRFALGTSPDVFFDYVSERFLTYIIEDGSLDEGTKNHLYAYMSRNYSNIHSSWPVIGQYYFRAQMAKALRAPFYYPFERMAAIKAYYRKKRIARLNQQGVIYWQLDREANESWLDSLPKDYPEAHVPALNWDSLYSKAKEKAIEISSNNDWGVENEYYTHYVKGKQKTIKTVPLSLNQEYKDYLALLGFLEKQNVEVLLVMQPINPYVYANIKDLKPLLDMIKEQALDRGFHYLDLMVWEKEGYEIGTLTDIMHMGELGWLKTNRSIINKLIPE